MLPFASHKRTDGVGENGWRATTKITGGSSATYFMGFMEKCYFALLGHDKLRVLYNGTSMRQQSLFVSRLTGHPSFYYHPLTDACKAFCRDICHIEFGEFRHSNLTRSVAIFCFSLILTCAKANQTR